MLREQLERSRMDAREKTARLDLIAFQLGEIEKAAPKAGEDERGRHAIEGPPEWIAERLREYVEAGCDGFVVNLGHDSPDLEDRVRRFGAEVAPLLT